MSFVERRRFLWILFLIGMALIAVVANATTLARLSFTDLVSQASAIARVRCLRSTSHWKRAEIWTLTEFAVEEQNKGQLPEVISVEMPGGRIAPLQAHIDEVPAFKPGEEAYLFLWTAPDGGYRILGWSQGAFRIHRDPATGSPKVTQESAAGPVFDPATRQFRRDGVRNVPLLTFQLKVKRALDGIR